MSTALWFLYFAGVAEGLQVVLILTAVFGSIGLGGWALFAAMEEADTCPRRSHWVIVASAALLACIIPSRPVLYAAAVLHAGDAALNTETGGEAMTALRAWLRRQAEQPSDE